MKLIILIILLGIILISCDSQISCDESCPNEGVCANMKMGQNCSKFNLADSDGWCQQIKSGPNEYFNGCCCK